MWMLAFAVSCNILCNLYHVCLHLFCYPCFILPKWIITILYQFYFLPSDTLFFWFCLHFPTCTCQDLVQGQCLRCQIYPIWQFLQLPLFTTPTLQPLVSPWQHLQAPLPLAPTPSLPVSRWTVLQHTEVFPVQWCIVTTVTTDRWVSQWVWWVMIS